MAQLLESRHHHEEETEASKRPKKISFKIKKTSSVYRRISASKVAELTKKFNMLDSDKVTRKPSVKTKPQDLVIVKRKPVKKCDSNVRKTIEIFEQKQSPNPVPKPKVPEKPPQLKIHLEAPAKTEETPEAQIVKPTPNTSFLWKINQDKSPSREDWRELYDLVETPQIPPRAMTLTPPPIPQKKTEEKIYEELSYETFDDGYEICEPEPENVYETLPTPTVARKQSEPLPPRPLSRSSTVQTDYESIYNVKNEGNYETVGSNRNSIISSDQQSNSLYGRASLVGWGDDATYKATSDLSGGSDEWVDVTDNEEGDITGSAMIVRIRQKPKKITGWSQQCREQWSKSLKAPECDADHLYETLHTEKEEPPDDNYDSFDSDSDSDSSFTKVNSNDSGLDIGNNQLPEPPSNQTYVLTRFAATVKRKLRRNWSLTKNDISKSLSRMTKRKSRTDLQADVNDERRKSFLTKFRRSMSLSTENANELTASLDKPKSTFYLTQEIDIDQKEEERDSGASLSPVPRPAKAIMRPQSPPPPVPKKRSTSWYAEVGLFKSELPKRPNTFWYAEVGLYQARSTPSTSSDSATNLEEYYNLKNYGSVTSVSSTDKKDIHLRLEEEPLYQFYDAAVLDSVCHDGTDFDSDGYEEVSRSHRPSAMELVSPQKTRTLWCEIPEVLHSSVLSTLSSHQKKLQEAKFEMITSEASYLNSLNVLDKHFIKNFDNLELLSQEEFSVLFGKVEAVRNCSEKLICDLERCWQENILLHGVCDIVQKHAEENFHVYVQYCENQILLDETLRRLKERTPFLEALKQMESSSTCQSLTLYSFLMLPMQRITRWPLLVDAVLKRLSPQDGEYLTCQYSLATLNKIVMQCNEAARHKERETEMRKIVTQMEFSKGVPPVEINSEQRWLIRSGPVTHMQQRSDETKLTFGKRFIKVSLHLFLFNDLLLVTKPKGDNLYTVVHYCQRNLVELSSTDGLSIPLKDSQNRHLLFLTLLENQHEKTIEFLLSCSSESDKERWIEALTPPKSEDPDETLYECWDCPQVTAIHNYSASQPDELALAKGDVINVLRKMADGWYHGERIRDGQTGWFPANYTTEIANPHVRSRNLKQRYRLLAFSENYLKTK